MLLWPHEWYNMGQSQLGPASNLIWPNERLQWIRYDSGHHWHQCFLSSTLPLHSLFPLTLSTSLTPSFSPSVHSPCLFPVLGPPVSLHRMPRLLRRLPSRRLHLNIDDDKCPNLSRAISISRAEGEGVGWASYVCVNITFHCVPFIYGVYRLHNVPCFVQA